MLPVVIGVVIVLVAAIVTGGLVLSGRSGGRAPIVAAPAHPASVEGTPQSSTLNTPVASAAPVDFASVYSQVNSGVVRIETVSCDADGVGSGFLLSPTLVATVDHVVDQSVSIALKTDTETTVGTVVGYDPSLDLALVRSSRPITGHVFQLSSALPSVGARVAAIGFPEGDPKTLTQGGVSGLNRTIDVEGHHRMGLIETDAAVNPGNSGGPLLSADGTVAGLADILNTQANGIAYAVPAIAAAPLFKQWTASPVVQPAATCSGALGPATGQQQASPGAAGLAPSNPQIDGAAIGMALHTYFTGIDTGDYDSAYAVLSDSEHQQMSLAQFAAETATSYDSDVTLVSATPLSDTEVGITLSFTSQQASDQGPDGDVCDLWTLDYDMVLDNAGSWRINAANPVNGQTHTSC